jgi:hypothetical protein
MKSSRVTPSPSCATTPVPVPTPHDDRARLGNCTDRLVPPKTAGNPPVHPSSGWFLPAFAWVLREGVPRLRCWGCRFLSTWWRSLGRPAAGALSSHLRILVNARLRNYVYVGIALLLVMVLLAALVVRSHRGRRAVVREERGRRMGYALLVLVNYSSHRGRLPPVVLTSPDGSVLGSWRFVTIPYMYSDMPDWDPTLPWDSPANREAALWGREVYCLPSSKTGERSFEANIVAIVGNGTAFSSPMGVAVAALPSDTVLLVETDRLHVHWMAPGDIDAEEIPPYFTAGPEGDGLYVGFADGSVWLLRPGTPMDVLRKFFTIEGARTFDRGQLLAPYAVPEFCR